MTAITDLIPIGGSILVGLIAGGFALGGQSLTHRGTLKREIEARRETFRVRRFEIERETLLDLQNALLAYNRTFLKLIFDTSLSPETSISTRLAFVDELEKIHQLASRTLDDKARESINEYILLASKMLDAHRALFEAVGDEYLHLEGPKAINDSVTDSFTSAQRAIGEALRRDPFTNEQI